MTNVIYQGALEHSCSTMAYCQNLHVNEVIVIVYTIGNGDNNDVSHDETFKQTSSRDEFTPPPIEQTP